MTAFVHQDLSRAQWREGKGFPVYEKITYCHITLIQTRVLIVRLGAMGTFCMPAGGCCSAQGPSKMVSWLGSRTTLAPLYSVQTAARCRWWIAHTW